MIQALEQVRRLDIKTINIDTDGLYTLVYSHIPIIKEQIVNHIDNLYIIPRSGDILHKITIVGPFQRAIIFQYDCFGNNRVIYETIEYPVITMQIFGESGIPLVCTGKTFYLEVTTNSKSVVVVHATFGFLPNKCRRELATWKHNDVGVKLQHPNGDMYQFVGLQDYCFSHICLVKCTTY